MIQTNEELITTGAEVIEATAGIEVTAETLALQAAELSAQISEALFTANNA